MIRQSLFVSLGASLLWTLGVRATSQAAPRVQRMTAEMPGWEENDYRIEENIDAAWGKYMWGGGKNEPKHARHAPPPHPAHDPHSWAEEEPKEHNPWHQEPDPWDPPPWYEPDPWHDEPDPWGDEPCIPVHTKNSAQKRPQLSKDSTPYQKGVWNEEDWEKQGFKGHERGSKEWAKQIEAEEKWWHEYAKEHKKGSKTSKSKGSKGMKGMKGKKRHKPKNKKPKYHKPRPCPTMEPTRAPTKAPSREPSIVSSRDVPAPTQYNSSSGKNRPDEVVVDLTSFTIQYEVLELRNPSEKDIEDIVDTTMDLLQDYFFEIFTAETGAIINFFTVASPEDKKSEVQNDLISVHFRANAYFDADSDVLPTTNELDTLLKQAFMGESLDVYHEELKDLPESSVFYAATVDSVWIGLSQYSAVNTADGVQPWSQDSTSHAITPLEEANDPHAPHDDPPAPKDVVPPPKDVSATLDDTRDSATTSSPSLSPPVKVVTIVASTFVAVGALFIYLYRKKSLKEKKQQVFPPPKGGGQSIAEVTMMEDEDSLVECEIGDDDFSVGSGRSTRRSRAENFLRLIEEEDNKSNRPKRFLVANASRRGNTWTQ